MAEKLTRAAATRVTTTWATDIGNAPHQAVRARLGRGSWLLHSADTTRRADVTAPRRFLSGSPAPLSPARPSARRRVLQELPDLLPRALLEFVGQQQPARDADRLQE